MFLRRNLTPLARSEGEGEGFVYETVCGGWSGQPKWVVVDPWNSHGDMTVFHRISRT